MAETNERPEDETTPPTPDTEKIAELPEENLDDVVGGTARSDGGGATVGRANFDTFNI